MLGLPVSTEVNRNVPKKKFYENLDVSAALKRHFIDEIKSIYWRNKISPETLNVEEGKTVREIEVFEVKLTGDALDEKVLLQIDREVPYHILFVLTKGEEDYERYQKWIGYKEEAFGKNAFKVSKYFHTEWERSADSFVKIRASSMDAIYDDLVRDIASKMPDDHTITAESADDTSIKENITLAAERDKVRKQIAKLERKLQTEKQLNKQMEIKAEIRRLQDDKKTYE